MSHLVGAAIAVASSVAWLAIDLTALGIVVYALIRRKGGDE